MKHVFIIVVLLIASILCVAGCDWFDKPPVTPPVVVVPPTPVDPEIALIKTFNQVIADPRHPEEIDLICAAPVSIDFRIYAAYAEYGIQQWDALHQDPTILKDAKGAWTQCMMKVYTINDGKNSMFNPDTTPVQSGRVGWGHDKEGHSTSGWSDYYCFVVLMQVPKDGATFKILGRSKVLTKKDLQ